ncbi:ribonuclease H-like domain-containing protein, partial [Tanacetum coccineum]
WGVDEAILAEQERVVIIHFGADGNAPCMEMDEVLASVANTNKHIMIDLGTGNNNKINFPIKDKQEFIDIVETVYRGARKGRGLVISPKDYSTNGNFTSPPGKIYHCAEIEWYDLVDSETFSINGYDAMLEDLGLKDGSILFSRFRIPGKSLDEGLVPLMSNQDVLSLLQYVPIYKEIEVYVENNTMEVVLGTGKGVVIEEVVDDDEVKEASETGNSGKQLLSVTENDVQTKTKPLTLPWSFESLSDSDINFSHKTLEMKNEVKAEQEMEEPVHNDFPPLMYEDDLLQKEDPVNYQQDLYHREDEAEENAELFDEQDHLLEHVPFLKETVIIVDGDAPLLDVDALVVPPVIVLDE